MPKYKTQPMKVGKTPFWGKYKDVTKIPKAMKLNTDFSGPGDPNKAPKMAKPLARKLNKKGLQTNYSK